MPHTVFYTYVHTHMAEGNFNKQWLEAALNKIPAQTKSYCSKKVQEQNSASRRNNLSATEETKNL